MMGEVLTGTAGGILEDFGAIRGGVDYHQHHMYRWCCNKYQAFRTANMQRGSVERAKQSCICRRTLRSSVVLSVRTSHCVTVAPPLLSITAMGVPTILLLPITTTFCPTTRTPCMARSITIPWGVQGSGRKSSLEQSAVRRKAGITTSAKQVVNLNSFYGVDCGVSALVFCENCVFS